MEVLVDTSVWIDYFRGGSNSQALDLLIDENLLATNDLILTELVPYLKVKKQTKVAATLQGGATRVGKPAPLNYREASDTEILKRDNLSLFTND